MIGLASKFEEIYFKNYYESCSLTISEIKLLFYAGEFRFLPVNKSSKFEIRYIYKTEHLGKIIQKYSDLGYFSKNGQTNYNNFYIMKLRNL